jgi:predicted nucleotidyltransferase
MRTKSGLGSVLFGAQRRRVLALLLLNPEQGFHVRELARRIECSPGSLHRELRQLAEVGVLKRTRVGNQVHYAADPGCPVYPELTGILRKTAGAPEALAELLAPLARRIESAWVFGSFAQGGERAGSDIDLLVVGQVEIGEVVEALLGAAQRLGREVNPVVYPPTRFREKLGAGDRFLKRVMDEPRLTVIGGPDVAHQPRQDQPTRTAPVRRR